MQTDSTYLTTIFRESSLRAVYSYKDLYQFDNLASLIIDTYPETAYSTGFKVVSESEEFYSTIMNNLGVWEVFKRASIWARLEGLSCVLLGAGGEPSTPLLPTQPIELLKIYSIPVDTDITQELIRLNDKEYHKSRLLFFKGKEVLESFGGEVGVKYCSVLDGLIDVLTKYREIPKLAIQLIKTCNQVAIGTKGLSMGIRNDILTGTTAKKSEIQARLQSLNEGRSIQDLILFDLENEQLTNTSLNLSGVEKQVEILENQLACRSGYPKHILFGDAQTTSLGSGEVAQLVQRMMWATQVSKWIDNNWTKGLETICTQMMTSLNLAEFKIEIPLALVLSAQEIAEINKLNTEVLEKLLALYPMELEEIKIFIEQHFESISLPDPINVTLTRTQPQPVPSEPSAEEVMKDSIIDDLNDLSNINQEEIDKTMFKIAQSSR